LAIGPPFTDIASTFEPDEDPPGEVVETAPLLILPEPPQPAAKAEPISKIVKKYMRKLNSRCSVSELDYPLDLRSFSPE
jgi:hypothetical protein